MIFKYRLRVEGASSVFEAIAEIVNDNGTSHIDTVCIDPGPYFWKFLDAWDAYCNWDELKAELMRRWEIQSNSIIEL